MQDGERQRISSWSAGYEGRDGIDAAMPDTFDRPSPDRHGYPDIFLPPPFPDYYDPSYSGSGDIGTSEHIRLKKREALAP
ncbi:MAG: hypothetical protein WC382_12880 [Methanoregulaceae archaeon]